MTGGKSSFLNSRQKSASRILSEKIFFVILITY